MKKTLLYLVFLGFLFGGIYLIFKKDSANPYATSESGFNIKDTANIGRLFIANYDGESVLIERTDTGWLLNKKYKALPSMLKMMMNTLYQQQPLYPVTKNVFKNAIQELSTLGTKVELYDKAGKIICKFYVGGSAPNASGTIMMMEGAQQPYVVHIQAFVGTLTNRFSARVQDWRDRKIFDFPETEIKSITVNYPEVPEHSFVLTQENSKVSVNGLNGTKANQDKLIEHNSKVYLGYFANVNCEGYLNGTEGMDSLIRTGKRHSIIDVEGINGHKKHIEIYWMALNKRSKNRESRQQGVPDDYDPDRLFALINNNQDTVMIQQFVFKNIFRSYIEFFDK